MAEPFIGEVRMVASNFAPYGWALCNGQLMSIRENTALFSLLGTTYGGDGITNFALPNLQGCVPIHQGTGPGLTPRELGESGGAPAVTVSYVNMPAHTHLAQCSSKSPDQSPKNAYWGSLGGRTSVNAYVDTLTERVMFAPQAVGAVGGGLPHNNMQPYLPLTFMIALEGLFPTRT